MDKFNGQKKVIELSDDLMVEPPESLSTSAAMRLMMRLSKTSVGRSKDGFVTDGTKVIGIKYDDAIASFCNGNFSEHFEEFYCILRKNGITL